ncbi:hypothetical protein K8S19_07975 [bacterium]|nr:hypothetical protein [bacterium]
MNRVETQAPVQFKARISFKHTWIFFAGMGLFFAGGIVMMFHHFYPGLAIAGFFGGMLAYLVVQVLALGSGYAVTDQGVTAQRFYKRTVFVWEHVRDVAIVSEEAAAQACLDYQNSEATGVVSRFRAANRLGQFIEFCTVNIVFFEETQGTEYQVTRRRAKADGDFVLLTTLEKKQYLLSPENPHAFFTRIQSRIQSTQDA